MVQNPRAWMKDYVLRRKHFSGNEINPAKVIILPLYARFQKKCIKGDAFDCGSGSYIYIQMRKIKYDWVYCGESPRRSSLCEWLYDAVTHSATNEKKRWTSAESIELIFYPTQWKYQFRIFCIYRCISMRRCVIFTLVISNGAWPLEKKNDFSQSSINIAVLRCHMRSDKENASFAERSLTHRKSPWNSPFDM